MIIAECTYPNGSSLTVNILDVNKVCLKKDHIRPSLVVLISEGGYDEEDLSILVAKVNKAIQPLGGRVVLGEGISNGSK